MEQKILIVGAGFYGAVVARQLADAGRSCVVIERRGHIGGNCYSEYSPEAGCHRHVYGPHIFHTDKEEVWRYVNRFASFNHFVNRPKVRFRGKLYSFPINLLTLYQLFGVETPAEAQAYLAKVREPIAAPGNMEEWCLATVGRALYETFVEGYTQKQWQRHPRELPADIIKRLPVRLTFDDNYFTHPRQGIPVGGYTALFENLLEGVPVELGVDFLADRDRLLKKFDRVVYTGALDEFFSYELGPLEYRSLRFETELLPLPDFQGNAIVNYTEAAVPYTRVVEHKHFDLAFGAESTVITREYPDDWVPGKVPYYPIGTPENQKRFEAYRALAREKFPQIVFGGRLGEYRYFDMDQVIEAALAQATRLLREA